jgi:hypothetical protein
MTLRRNRPCRSGFRGAATLTVNDRVLQRCRAYMLKWYPVRGGVQPVSDDCFARRRGGIG